MRTKQDMSEEEHILCLVGGEGKMRAELAVDEEVFWVEAILT